MLWVAETPIVFIQLNSFPHILRSFSNPVCKFDIFIIDSFLLRIIAPKVGPLESLDEVFDCLVKLYLAYFVFFNLVVLNP